MIQSTLKARGSRYGDFKDVAQTTNDLMRVINTAKRFNEINEQQFLALQMICNKIARAVNGDPNYQDNWHDIAGYATLAEQSCAETGVPDVILEAVRK